MPLHAQTEEIHKSQSAAQRQPGAGHSVRTHMLHTKASQPQVQVQTAVAPKPRFAPPSPNSSLKLKGVD